MNRKMRNVSIKQPSTQYDSADLNCCEHFNNVFFFKVAKREIKKLTGSCCVSMSGKRIQIFPPKTPLLVSTSPTHSHSSLSPHPPITLPPLSPDLPLTLPPLSLHIPHSLHRKPSIPSFHSLWPFTLSLASYFLSSKSR